jgi:hypothetical protein
MRRLTIQEWKREYLIWRVPYAHLHASVRTRMVRGCKGKAQYDDPDEARADAAALPDRGDDKRWLKVYRCPLCQTYHIGNTRWRENGFTIRDRESADNSPPAGS